MVQYCNKDFRKSYVGLAAQRYIGQLTGNRVYIYRYTRKQVEMKNGSGNGKRCVITKAGCILATL